MLFICNPNESSFITNTLTLSQILLKFILNNLKKISASKKMHNLFAPNPQQVKNTSSWLLEKRGLVLGVGIGILIAGVGGRILFPQASQKYTAKSTIIESPKKSQSVTIETVKQSQINRTLTATGTVEAYKWISVLAKATGLQIQDILVEEGDFVRAGQVLAKLDDAVLKAQLNQEQTLVTQAEARLAELNAGNRPEEIARAKENVNIAQAEVLEAKSDLELAQTRVERNQNLETEGAITRDHLDEVLNEERSRRSRLQQARGRLEEAKQQLKELEAGPRQEVITQAEAELAQAKAQQQLRRTELDNSVVKAPRSGLIAERDDSISVGQTTSASTPLFRIIENGQLELQIQVTETDLPQILSGQAVTITSDADSTLEFVGRVREIDPIIDSASRQATVKVDLPKDSSLKPGMFLRAKITVNSTTGLTISMDGVLPQTNGIFIVYVVEDDNTVKIQSIKLGELLPGNQVEILEGLAVGDRIVMKGKEYLSDGDLVSEQ